MPSFNRQIKQSKRAAKELRSRISHSQDIVSIYELFVLPIDKRKPESKTDMHNFNQIQKQLHGRIEQQIQKMNVSSTAIENLDLKIRGLLIDGAISNSPEVKKFEKQLDQLPQLVSEWLQAAKELETTALRVVERSQQSMSGIELLQSNIIEWEAALNPRYDMDGELLAIHQKAVADAKSGNTLSGLPMVTNE